MVEDSHKEEEEEYAYVNERAAVQKQVEDNVQETEDNHKENEDEADDVYLPDLVETDTE